MDLPSCHPEPSFSRISHPAIQNLVSLGFATLPPRTRFLQDLLPCHAEPSFSGIFMFPVRGSGIHHQDKLTSKPDEKLKQIVFRGL